MARTAHAVRAIIRAVGQPLPSVDAALLLVDLLDESEASLRPADESAAFEGLPMPSPPPLGVTRGSQEGATIGCDDTQPTGQRPEPVFRSKHPERTGPERWTALQHVAGVTAAKGPRGGQHSSPSRTDRERSTGALPLSTSRVGAVDLSYCQALAALAFC